MPPPEDRRTKRKFNTTSDAGFTNVHVELAQGVSFGDTTSTSTAPSYKDALDDSRSHKTMASTPTMGGTIGDDNESYVSLITTMQHSFQSFQSNFSSMSATIQTNFTQLLDTMMKNSEAD